MKSHLITLGLNLGLKALARVPKALIPSLAKFLARIYALIPSRDRNLIEINIQRVYGLTAHSNYTKTFCRQVFQSQIAIFLETIKSTFSPDQLLKIDGLDHLGATLESIKRPDQGLIIITAHLGSWEFVAKYVALASKRSFYALAKPSSLPEFTPILESIRAKSQTKVLWTDSKNLLREMIRVLKNGDYLGFVMDQKPEGRIGPVVQFLGQATEFVAGPAKLSIRHQCPIVAVFCVRTGPWQYTLISQAIVKGDHGITDEELLTQRMSASIEECIRVYPEQWVWNYKRWRTGKAAGKSTQEQSKLASSS